MPIFSSFKLKKEINFLFIIVYDDMYSTENIYTAF